MSSSLLLESGLSIDDLEERHSERYAQYIVSSDESLQKVEIYFTTPKGSCKEYTTHDLIVNESVFEEGIPYLRTLGDDDARHRESPVNRSFANMPPLCLLVSEHECCYEQNIELVNNAINAGVEVDLAVWKYMCHVWIVLSAFLPEARSAVDVASDWIVKNTSSSGGDYPNK